MKKLVILAFICLGVSVSAQTLEKKVDHFNKIIASPKINLVLVEGENESVKIDYANIDPSKIHISVKGKVLRIYLDGSRFTEKKERVNFNGEVRMMNKYRDATITAYVSYSKLRKLVVRGEQQVAVKGSIENKKFKLSAYGECDIEMKEVHVGWFKAALYGQNSLKIETGSAGSQKYKLFGENKIDTQAIQSEDIESTTYGESKLKLLANDNLRLVTVGESNVLIKGSPRLSKLTLGEISIRR
ncbi:MAG: DUF2807 domain-containing protein [Cyclobacteriaceae bacterium]